MRFLTARPGPWLPVLPLALLVCLLSAVPARAGADPAPAPAPAPVVVPEQKPVLVLDDWDYTAAMSRKQLVTDVIVFLLWVDLNLAGHTVAPRMSGTTTTGNGNGTGTMTNPGLVSRRIYGVLFLEYVYDVSVVGKISQAQLDALVFGEYFLNQLFVVPGLTGTTG